MNARLQVLIADDSPAARHVLRAGLTTLPGVEVAAAARDGGEALALCEALAPDVLVIDHTMPVMDGPDVVRELTRRGRRPRRVYVLSAERTAAAAAVCAGADRFFHKRRGLGDLLGTVASCDAPAGVPLRAHP